MGRTCVYKKSGKFHPPTKIGIISFAKPHSKKNLALTLNHLMILMYRFVIKTRKNLQKGQIVLPVSSKLFQPLFQVDTSVTTPMAFWSPNV